jgi:adenine-specific DNA-methyltransferase
LREYVVTHTELRQIIDFGDEAVFDALAYPTIVIATKRDKPLPLSDVKNDVLVLNWDSSNPDYRVSDFPDVFAAERFAVPQAELKPGGWQLEPPRKRMLLARVRKAGQPLIDYVNRQLYYGIKTGLNEAFVISREQRDALIAEDKNSVDVLKPYLRGRDVKRWHAEPEDLWLIFIPWHFPLQDLESISGASVKAEKQFQETYPAIYKHLLAYKTELSARDKSEIGIRYEWYALARHREYWREFLRPKIIFPAIQNEVSYAADLDGHFGNDKTNIIVSDNWRYVLTVLNSAVSWWLTRELFASKQGGYFEFKPMYVSAIPVPSITGDQRKLIDPLVNSVLRGISRPEFERLLNGLVYELFFPEDLHAKNIRLFDACASAGIGNWPQPETHGADAAKGNAAVARAAFAMAASSTAEEIFHPRHPIYGMLFELQTLEVVRLIESQP